MPAFAQPVVVVKDGQKKEIAWSVILREHLDAGWVIEGEEPKEPVPAPIAEVPVQAGYEAGYGNEPEPVEEVEEEDLNDCTKVELLAWALERGHDLRNNAPKGEILEQCLKIQREGLVFEKEG